MDWPIVSRETIREEKMPKVLGEKERAFDKRIVRDEGLIIPDIRAMKRRDVNGKTK